MNPFCRNRPEQQMHHSVWPPSSTGNNTHCRHPPPHRKSDALTGQTEPPPRQCRQKRHTSNCEDAVGSILAKRNLRPARAGSNPFIASSLHRLNIFRIFAAVNFIYNSIPKRWNFSNRYQHRGVETQNFASLQGLCLCNYNIIYI